MENTNFYSGEKALDDYPVLKGKKLIEAFKTYRKWSTNKSNCGRDVRRRGKEAYEMIVISNIRLVIKIAGQYRRNDGMDMQDLVSEGNYGMVKAVERFDPDRGKAFSTYAQFWIRRYIRLAMSNQSRDIRIPHNLAEKIGKIKQFVAEFTFDNEREPTADEIKENFKGLSKRAINDLFNQIPSNGEEVKAFGDIVEDVKFDKPDEAGTKTDDVNNLTLYVNKLPRREKWIITRRFGLNNKDVETLEKISERYGVTRERIRQLEFRAMRKLRTMMGKQYQENFFIPK
jgi:RNA polymerase primary sigma factor